MIPWLAGHVLWPLTERLRRRDTMARVRQLRATQTATPDAMRAIQQAKLRRILAIAAEHSPFYRDRFLTAGFDPAAPDLALSHLRSLPTLTRADIRDHRDAMTWHGCPRGGPQRFTTGGSSGEPLIFYFDRFRQAADWAARWRARQWWDVHPGDRELLLWGSPIELNLNDRLRQWRDALLNQQILDAFDMTADTMNAYIRTIRHQAPSCLYGYASSLALLARHALSEGLQPGKLGSGKLKAIFVTGEVLLDPDRQAIEHAFNAPVVIEYGSRDGGLIAYQCPCGQLHIPEEHVLVELLDPQGQPVAPGEPGEVVLTLLENRAMPMIRYRTGDLARASTTSPPSLDEPATRTACSNGVTLSSLIEVKGRLTDQIVCRANGQVRRMHALALIYVLREMEGIAQFRITQRELDRLDVEIVPDDRYTDATQRRIEHGLRQRMGPGVNIDIRCCETIPPTASGKHACVVSHVA